MIIDASNLIMGRLASNVAKRALEGESITIINSQNAVITGKKNEVYARYKNLREIGHHSRGPFYYRNPDYFLKRTIRGMLPHKNERGINAMKRIVCYVGVPEQLKDKKAESMPDVDISTSNTTDYVTVGAICKLLGGRK